MSSTKRGRDRNRNDFYRTDPWCVHRLLEYLPLPDGDWLEPCAGDGSIIKAVNAVRKDVVWSAVELRASEREKFDDIEMIRTLIVGDYFKIPDTLNFWRGFSVVITNPPFSLAMEFIQDCRLRAEHTLMLLRLNFLGSHERFKFMRETRPDIYVLPNRPSFLEKTFVNKRGQRKTRKVTDSIEYAWFHWHKNSTGIWRLLDETPKKERG